MSRTYTDHADHIDLFVKRRGPYGGLVFPVKLFLILKYIDLKEPHLRTIISWNRHGRSFKIHDQRQFRQIIMPRFYTSTSDKTFRRQLSFWGFRKISASLNEPENGSLYHEKFLRSKDYLCRMIPRNLASSPPLPESEEPDFENMRALPPSDERRLTRPESDDELFELLLTSSNKDASARRSSNQSSSVVPSNAHANHTGMDLASLNSSIPFSTYLNQQQALHMMTASSSSSILPPRPALLQMQQQTVNPLTANNDGSQAYRNLDLEQLLSDENEWRWRHLQPFPIGFQPPLSQSESEEFEQVMSFIRRISEN